MDLGHGLNRRYFARQSVQRRNHHPVPPPRTVGSLAVVVRLSVTHLQAAARLLVLPGSERSRCLWGGSGREIAGPYPLERIQPKNVPEPGTTLPERSEQRSP